MTHRLAKVGLCFLPLVLLLAPGCETSRSVRGKVVAGPSGIATVVAANDARLAEPGWAGVRVRVGVGDSPTPVAEATSAADGSFALRVDDRTLSRRLEIYATGESILPLRTSAYLPLDGRTLLLIVEPIETMDGGERAR